MSHVNINDPRIKKVNFRQANGADIALLMGGNSKLAADHESAEAYFAAWEQKHAHSLTGNKITLKVEEVRDLRMSDWTSRVDPFLQITCGDAKAKTPVQKRTTDPKFSETFNFPIPLDYETKSLELTIEVCDAQLQNSCIGFVSLDLNDIFSEDDDPRPTRTPLVLSYQNIWLNLDTHKFGEDPRGQILLSLSTSIPLPKLPPIRQRKMGYVDLQLTPNQVLSLLTDKEVSLYQVLDGCVKQASSILPELLEASGGSFLLQSYLGDSSSTSSPLAGVSVGKIKGLFSGKSGFSSHPTLALKKHPNADIEGPLAQLPVEIVESIFQYLPPWDFTLRGVCSKWNTAGGISPVPLWSTFQSFRRASKATTANKEETGLEFCRNMREVVNIISQIVQFSTTISYSLSPWYIPPKDRANGMPVILGCLEPLLELILLLAQIDWIKSAVSTTVMLHSKSSTLWKEAVTMFKNNYKTYLVGEEEPSGTEAVLFSDDAWWTSVNAFFTDGRSAIQMSMFDIQQPEDVVNVLGYMECVRLTLEKRRFTKESEARLLCKYLIAFLILTKTIMALNKPKEKPYLAILKEFEAFIPADLVKLLIVQKIIKDKSFTPK